MAKRLTKQERVLNYLKQGYDITENQAENRFDIKNMDSVASKLRFLGFAIYKNRKTFSNGNTGSVYRLGTPSRSVVAAGYRALAA